MEFSDYDDAIRALSDQYEEGALSKDLAGFLLAMYDGPKEYLGAIGQVFYEQLPEDLATGPRTKLSAKDRERILIALLATRRGAFALAVHIYLALMMEITNDEIANIIFLAGVYSGADNLTNGLFTHKRTLETLKKVSKSKERDATAVDT